MAKPTLSRLIQDLLDAREEFQRLAPTAHPEVQVALEARLAQAQTALDALIEDHWGELRRNGGSDADRH